MALVAKAYLPQGGFTFLVDEEGEIATFESKKEIYDLAEKHILLQNGDYEIIKIG